MNVDNIPNPPNHIAIIPDGNRRWAKEHMLNLYRGYNLGIKKFIDVSLWAKRFGVRTISVWALSTENLVNRSPQELNVLFALYKRAAYDKSLLNKLNKNKAKVDIIGDSSKLPDSLRQALKSVKEKTKDNSELTINILLDYGGREDLLYAVKRLMAKKEKIKLTYDILKQNLRSALVPDIDLVIRTSGEQRTSGLLPWQTSYSEFYFSKKYWPSFNRDDLREAIEDFSNRQRRFGK
ncbi:undecaprenyl diphosphate synthase [mine drainage metagenome]|uniref:Undecaprenyl diphosphate synthase n=1 Tax=mine drainage metagenome TaxID=410659 RepID=T0Y8H3_9ZZZZ